MGLIGSGGKQDDADCRKLNGKSTIRPCCDDPKQSEGTNGDKRARRADKSRQPIWHPQPNSPAVRNGSARVVNEQRQPVERTDDASQNLGCLIGKQPQRWRLRRQGDQPLDRLLANSAQTDRIAYPICRPALPRSRTQFPWQRLQNGVCFLATLVIRELGKAHRHYTPTGDGFEQAGDACQQHRLMSAELRRFSERLVEDRVERKDAPHELDPNRLSVREIRSGQCKCVGKPLRDLGGKDREHSGEPALGATQISSREYDASRDDADADLAATGHGQHEDLVIRTPGRP